MAAHLSSISLPGLFPPPRPLRWYLKMQNYHCTYHTMAALCSKSADQNWRQFYYVEPWKLKAGKDLEITCSWAMFSPIEKLCPGKIKWLVSVRSLTKERKRIQTRKPHPLFHHTQLCQTKIPRSLPPSEFMLGKYKTLLPVMFFHWFYIVWFHSELLPNISRVIYNAGCLQFPDHLVDTILILYSWIHSIGFKVSYLKLK